MIPAYYSCTFTVRYTPIRFTRPVVSILSGVLNFRLNVCYLWRHRRLQESRELSLRLILLKGVHEARLRLASCTFFLLPVFVFVFSVPGCIREPKRQRRRPEEE